MKLNIPALVLFMGLTCVASADEEKGWFLGGGIGQLNVQADDISETGSIQEEFDSESTSFKVFAGWRFNRFLAAELDYLDFGSPDDDVGGERISTDITGVAPYLIGSLALGPLEFFGKAGYLFYDPEVEVSGREVESASGSQEDLIYGIGVGIILFDRLQARLEYEAVDVSETFDDVDALWLSGAWRF
jgi:hypothetical protein